MLSSAVIPAIVTYIDVNIDGIELCDKKNESEDKGKEIENDCEQKYMHSWSNVFFERSTAHYNKLEITLLAWNNHISNIKTPPPEQS